MIGSPAPLPQVQARSRSARWWTLLLTGLVLVLQLSWPAPSWALSLPGFGPRESPGGTRPLTPTSPAGRLQESPPPVAVQQLQEALADFQPLITVESPRNQTLLPDGPWELRLRVQDWPLIDAGSLGLGTHVVVQIDQQAPLRIANATEHVSLSSEGDHGNDQRVVVPMPALSPGSHRITAYAARPWGEAVKSPGALSQIQVHRVAANPMVLPTKGSPQLLAVSPADRNQAEPVLLDWLLLDAPLQNLRPGDGSWRLRVTINGDSFLVDQNVPLWLRGWRKGSNSLLLELVDGLGEPLNPPFNSLVQEVTLEATSAAALPNPRWLQGRLQDSELAVLLGQASPEPEPAARPETEAQPEPEVDPAPEMDQDAAPNGDGAPAATTMESAADQTREPSKEATADPSGPEGDAATAQANPLVDNAALVTADDSTASQGDIGAESAQANPHEPLPPAAPMPTDTTGAETVAETTPQPQASERISSTSPLGGSAREQVNADGSLIQAQPSGPWSGLRQRIGR